MLIAHKSTKGILMWIDDSKANDVNAKCKHAPATP